MEIFACAAATGMSSELEEDLTKKVLVLKRNKTPQIPLSSDSRLYKSLEKEIFPISFAFATPITKLQTFQLDKRSTSGC